MPFSRGRQVGVGTLALCNVCLPFGLTGQSGQPSHVALPVEIVYRVAYHKDMSFITIELHIEDADFPLSGHHFGPDMRMDVTISFDELGVIDEF